MFVYRLIISLAAPVFVAMFALRALRGREDWGTFFARLGRIGSAKHPTIWFHGASNGELASLYPVIDAFRHERPEYDLLITCNTQTGCELAASWQLENATVQVAPFDLRHLQKRLLRRQKVAMLITVEAEFWPNRFMACTRENTPIALIGARMSAKSAQRWRRFHRLAQRLMAALSLISPQDTASEQRFLALGAARDIVTYPIALKSLYQPLPDAILPGNLVEAFPRDRTWLAASTHDGEDEVTLQAHQQLLNTQPGMRLIIAPRHATRATHILQIAHSLGLSVARRSEAGAPDAQVYLADTMGEMALWYQLASVTFVAGSLVDRGGHTPYEPAAYGSAILHGPHVSNFRSEYQDLRAANASIQVTNATELATAVADLSKPTRSAGYAGRAAKALAPQETLPYLIGRLIRLKRPAKK